MPSADDLMSGGGAGGRRVVRGSLECLQPTEDQCATEDEVDECPDALGQSLDEHEHECRDHEEDREAGAA